MDHLDGQAHLMIVSDLDCTMVDHDDPEDLSLLRFNALWESEYRHNSLLIFSTGRSPATYQKLKTKKPLLTPDVTILSVGTEIFYGESMVPDDAWEHYLNHKWNRDIVMEETTKFPQLISQQAEDQRPHKVSYFVRNDHAEEVVKCLSERLANRGLETKVIYSGGKCIDVLPLGAGKGEALQYLHDELKKNGKLPIDTLVCGDSGNDTDLFTVPEVHGVVVSNAHDELLQWYAHNSKDYPKIIHASERCASGIIQAIGHFGLGPKTSPRDVMDLSRWKTESFHPSQVVVKFYLIYERWRRAEVENSDLTIQYMRSISHPNGIIVLPSGVQCSLRERIDAVISCYGDKRGKRFRVWLDRVSFSQISSDAWLVKFDKWELSDAGRQCCLTTILLNLKDEAEAETSPGPSLVHVHQTWMDGYAASDQTAWFF
ncbi:sucrose-phosphatase 1-like [Zingiber officinale]|uniref:Sucrose-phosphatase n=1 Tax=Zingiber officinale TaxID=94328 RepID=A0A8J5LJP0_ZINOF|nr:sucrose-phosphatase 1-like [Zingiber officinale]XP_042377227.1 sucrose-phosphatase 1-like [Zingiber officinale]KAG6514863.1 hypothetical protein ZIOFF_025238 [Zingiber officinale]